MVLVLEPKDLDQLDQLPAGSVAVLVVLVDIFVYVLSGARIAEAANRAVRAGGCLVVAPTLPDAFLLL